jgi:hypothetical protein
MKAVYPFIGGSASSHKWNLKDPRDLDAAFRLSFAGGITHSSTGVLFNGSTGYANTNLVPNTDMSAYNMHLSFYSRSNVSAGTAIDFGGLGTGGSSQYMHMHLRYTGDIWYALLHQNNSGIDSVSNNTSLGFFNANRTANNSKTHFRNGTNLGTSTTVTSAAFTTSALFLGAGNVDFSPSNYSNKECAFASIGDGLNNTEAAAFYTAVQTFQTTLGRSIGTQTVSDSDAQAFVTAADIQDQVQAEAVNQLVVDLKAASIWTKMKAVYPFVGGSATAHKWNLKDPRDLDAAYRLSFAGGITHDSLGITGNGTTGYADTFLNAKAILGLDNAHISIYSRTNSDGLYCDMGVSYNTFDTNIFAKYTNTFYPRIGAINSGIANAGTSQRVFISNRVSSTEVRGMQDGVLKVISSTSQDHPNAVIYIGALKRYLNTTTFYSPRNYAFATIGDGLTDQNMTDLTTAVNIFQTTLSRNV